MSHIKLLTAFSINDETGSCGIWNLLFIIINFINARRFFNDSLLF